MIQQNITVKNKIGIHSRPAALLVDTASRFKSKITIRNGERSALTTSMVKLLALRVKQDNEITITAEGEDEAEALKALSELIESKFGEE
ncbi:MAG TPA: phosphocarrier protein HPr [Treponema sp.]|nr:phosphocarrier protein HPr [Treponema sp.]